MILLALVLWLCAEIAAGFAVAHWIGVLPCILLLLAGLPVGAAVMRAQGRATIARLRQALSGARPVDGIADGVLALLAGPLLIVPGFLTDVAAGLLLVPAVRRRCWSLLAGRIGGGRLRTGPGSRSGGAGARQSYDVDGTAHETAPSDRATRRPQLHG